MIQVRELVIKATVSQQSAGGAKPSANTQSGNVTQGTDQIINTCVEKVLAILKAQNQR
jgi:hypothetical protein